VGVRTSLPQMSEILASHCGDILTASTKTQDVVPKRTRQSSWQSILDKSTLSSTPGQSPFWLYRAPLQYHAGIDGLTKVRGKPLMSFGFWSPDWTRKPHERWPARNTMLKVEARSVPDGRHTEYAWFLAVTSRAISKSQMESRPMGDFLLTIPHVVWHL